MHSKFMSCNCIFRQRKTSVFMFSLTERNMNDLEIRAVVGG